MLTKIEIENYRSLRHVELEMKPLNVLIGPNGGGKSNLLDVFALMAEGANSQLEDGIARRGGIGTIASRSEVLHEIFFGFDFSADLSPDPEDNGAKSIVYNLVLTSNGVKREHLLRPNSRNPFIVLRVREQNIVRFKGYANAPLSEKPLISESELALSQIQDPYIVPAAYDVWSYVKNWMLYQPIRTDVDASIRLPQTVRSGTRLFRDGSNLASVLQVIQSQYPAEWEAINDVLKTAYPDFHHLSFAPEGGDGKILLRWWEYPFEKDFGFSVNVLSDGTLRFLTLATILKAPHPPSIICIEEPEIGLHPDWIALIAELLESASTRTQVVVTTHSPELVSHLKPEEVVVVEKENGESNFTRLNPEELAAWLNKFRLGDLWLSGDLGGQTW